jgi:hypothetical protein
VHGRPAEPDATREELRVQRGVERPGGSPRQLEVHARDARRGGRAPDPRVVRAQPKDPDPVAAGHGRQVATLDPKARQLQAPAVAGEAQPAAMVDAPGAGREVEPAAADGEAHSAAGRLRRPGRSDGDAGTRHRAERAAVDAHGGGAAGEIDLGRGCRGRGCQQERDDASGHAGAPDER